jgi:hypothetical protein
MRFELLPIIDIMLEIYQKPRDFDRFQDYLKLLQGNTKGDLVLPIGGFNPMAKEHILQKLMELKELEIESIIQNAIDELNILFKNDKNTTVFKVAFNLSDDFGGGWTNRYTTDFDSKFKINALVERRFCIPIFWTSETFTPDLIKERILEYAFRYYYWLAHPKPNTLREHIEQEIFVSKNIPQVPPSVNLPQLESFYLKNKETDNYNIIFNFLYGDIAAQSLAFPTYGIDDDWAGFKFAKAKAFQLKK